MLWPALDFHFRGDNYTMNKVRIVSLTHNRPTGPPLHPYQILSNYLKQYGSYGLHKILASVPTLLEMDFSPSLLTGAQFIVISTIV